MRQAAVSLTRRDAPSQTSLSVPPSSRQSPSPTPSGGTARTPQRGSTGWARSTVEQPTSASSRQATSSPPSTAGRRRKGLLVVADRDVAFGHASLATREWVAKFGRFECVDEVTVSGFALLAVDTWVLDRSRLTNTVVNVTGNAGDQVVTYLLCPVAELSEVEATQELEAAVKRLRKDRARPIETEHGILMVTSLSTLSHEVQVIHIPGGDYRRSQADLFVRMNLKRFGCGGRSSLTIDTPSQAVQAKFCSMFWLPLPSERAPFNAQVLELVRLIQTALFHHGLYGKGENEDPDGLLCESTIRGMLDWLRDLSGDQAAAADMDQAKTIETQSPAIVAALLSEITSVRYKLLALDIDEVPTDPFTHLRQFRAVLGTFQRLYCPQQRQIDLILSSKLVGEITNTYQRERSHEDRRLTRKLRHQVSAAGAGIASNVLHFTHGKRDSDGHNEDSVDSPNGASAEPLLADTATTHLDLFVRAIHGSRDRDGIGAGRIRALWTGHIARPAPLIEWIALSGRVSLQQSTEATHEREEMTSPTRQLEHLPRRDRHSIRGVTARTGLALKDGITGWARRGTIFGDTSDSDSVQGERFYSSPIADGRQAFRKGTSPIVVFPPSDFDEASARSTPVPSTRAGRSGVFEADGNSSDRLPSSIHRPPFANHASSFTGSDQANGTLSDVPGSERGYEVSDRVASGSTSRRDGHRPTRLLLEPSSRYADSIPLVRTASAGAVAAIGQDGCEYVHEGHGMRAVQARLACEHHAPSARRGGRSWSFSHASGIPPIEVLPTDMMAVDVGLCGVIWQMTDRLGILRDSAQALQVLETAMFDCQSSFVDEVRARRARLERLQAEAAELSRDHPAAAYGTGNGSARLASPAPDGVAAAAEPSTLQLTLRAERDMEEKAKKLHYSLRDLDKTMGHLNYAKEQLVKALREYDLLDPESRPAEVEPVVVPQPTWWDLSWLRPWTSQSA